MMILRSKIGFGKNVRYSASETAIRSSFSARRYIAQKRMIIVRKANNALKNPLTLRYTCGAKTYVQICRLSQPLIA